ncbi:MAG: ABC transporter substrate-binding protein, partial [Chloroflexota bacterium]
MFTAIGILMIAAFPAMLAGNRGADARQATPAPAFSILLEAVDEPYAATPSGEQLLRLAGPVDPVESLDPALARDYNSAFLTRQVFRGLVHLDHNLEVQAELASRVEVSPDGLVYRFTIRDGATFHDGSPITSRDVVGSLARSLDPDTAGGDPAALSGPSYLSDIAGSADVLANRTDDLAGAVATDERTVEIRLAAPRSTFLMKLSTSPGLIVDVDQAASDPEWWRTPNGSGPFRVSEWVPDERLVLAPFNTYIAGVPVLQRVELRLGPSAANAFNLYQSGQVDIAAAPVSALDRLLDPREGIPDEVTVTPIYSITFIVLGVDTPPLDDPAIREALVRSFPSEQMAEVGFGGRKIAATGLIPPGMLGRDWPVSGSSYDPAAARAALARSRYD